MLIDLIYLLIMLYMYLYQDPVGVPDAVNEMTTMGVKQPVLFRCQDRLWIKADNTAIAVDCTCFDDGIELLFMSYFVFHVEYPNNVRMVFGMLERVLGIEPEVKNSSLIDDFMRKVGFVV